MILREQVAEIYSRWRENSPNRVGGEFTWRSVQVAYTTTAQQTLGSNSRRVSIIVSNFGAKDLVLLTRQSNAISDGIVIVPTMTTQRYLFKDVGPLVWSEIWTLANVMGGDAMITEVTSIM